MLWSRLERPKPIQFRPRLWSCASVCSTASVVMTTHGFFSGHQGEPIHRFYIQEIQRQYLMRVEHNPLVAIGTFMGVISVLHTSVLLLIFTEAGQCATSQHSADEYWPRVLSCIVWRTGT